MAADISTHLSGHVSFFDQLVACVPSHLYGYTPFGDDEEAVQQHQSRFIKNSYNMDSREAKKAAMKVAHNDKPTASTTKSETSSAQPESKTEEKSEPAARYGASLDDLRARLNAKLKNMSHTRKQNELNLKMAEKDHQDDDNSSFTSSSASATLSLAKSPVHELDLSFNKVQFPSSHTPLALEKRLSLKNKKALLKKAEEAEKKVMEESGAEGLMNKAAEEAVKRAAGEKDYSSVRMLTKQVKKTEKNARSREKKRNEKVEKERMKKETQARMEAAKQNKKRAGFEGRADDDDEDGAGDKRPAKKPRTGSQDRPERAEKAKP